MSTTTRSVIHNLWAAWGHHWHGLLDALLGQPCRLGCGERTYSKDIAWHEDLEHAGDRIWGPK